VKIFFIRAGSRQHTEFYKAAIENRRSRPSSPRSRGSSACTGWYIGTVAHKLSGASEEDIANITTGKTKAMAIFMKYDTSDFTQHLRGRSANSSPLQH